MRVRNCLFAVTDGASVVKKVAKDLGMQSQVCLVHGLHIAVCKTLLASSDSLLEDLYDVVYAHDRAEDDADESDEVSITSILTQSEYL